MSHTKAVTAAVRHVRPILSLNRAEAKRRVLNLYRAWYRQIPYIVMEYDIPKNIAQCRSKLREEFEKNKNISDIRVIDCLVIKGQMNLKEVVNMWRHRHHMMEYWKDTYEPKPTDFISKFIAGSN